MVKLNTDQPGLSGLGDASPMQNDAEVMSFVAELTARYLVGEDPLDSGVLHNVLYMDQQARGGRIATTALSGIDMALWDLKGKILDQPVYRLLGGAHRTRIRVYANGWYTNPGTPAQNADEAKIVVDMGYTALKFDPFGQTNYYTISLSEAQLAQDRGGRRAQRGRAGGRHPRRGARQVQRCDCHSTRQADGGVPAALL